MSIVANARRLKGRAENMLLPQRFVFHHVPKCGGTSVGRALRKRYLLSQVTVKPETSFRAFEAFTHRMDRNQMLIDVLDLREQMLLYHMFDDVRGISLHVRFSQIAWELFQDKYKFVTILRDPVDRFVSHFNWSHDKPHAHGHIEESFEAFLATDRAKRLGATYVEYLCGLPKEIDIRSDRAIAAAISNLEKFSVVGNLANVQDFESDLQRELSVRIKVAHENRIPSERKTISLDDLPDPLVQKVQSLCQPDIAIWQEARKGFKS